MELCKTFEEITNEDMLAPMDSPAMSGGDAGNQPGQFIQTPGSMPGDNMDMFALAGPGKKKKKDETKDNKSGKKEENIPLSNIENKVLTFADFLSKSKNIA